MAGSLSLPDSKPAASRDRSYRGTVECLHCSQHWLAEIKPGAYAVLRRDGTLSLTCPRCGSWGAHRLVRIGPR